MQGAEPLERGDEVVTGAAGAGRCRRRCRRRPGGAACAAWAACSAAACCARRLLLLLVGLGVGGLLRPRPACLRCTLPLTAVAVPAMTAVRAIVAGQPGRPIRRLMTCSSSISAHASMTAFDVGGRDALHDEHLAVQLTDAGRDLRGPGVLPGDDDDGGVGSASPRRWPGRRPRRPGRAGRSGSRAARRSPSAVSASNISTVPSASLRTRSTSSTRTAAGRRHPRWPGAYLLAAALR